MINFRPVLVRRAQIPYHRFVSLIALICHPVSVQAAKGYDVVMHMLMKVGNLEHRVSPNKYIYVYQR